MNGDGGTPIELEQGTAIDPHAGHDHWTSGPMIGLYGVVLATIVAPAVLMSWRYRVRIRAARELMTAAELREKAERIERRALTGEKTDPSLERKNG